jgi:predicted phosphate transport protein (TIGR00153 family)
MKLRLGPEERAFYDLFRRDIANCHVAVTALRSLLHDFRSLKESARKIHDIEREGDRHTVEVFALLNRSSIIPFEREDIIALASIVDDVLDQVDEVATMLALYGVGQPTVYLLEASMLLDDAVGSLVAAIDRLESLKGVAPYVAEVHRLETEADGLYHNAIAELFLPNTYSPIDVLKWTRIYDAMEKAFDACEDAGKVLENLVLKNG